MRSSLIVLPLGLASWSAATGQRPAEQPPATPPAVVRIIPAPAPSPPPARLLIAANGQSIIVDGVIGRGTATRFETLIESAVGVRTVVLNSNGGWMDEAERMAQIVRERRLNTYVETACRSACTLILIAGQDRAASPNARIGFHRPIYHGSLSPSDAQIFIDTNRSLYDRAGISRSFTDRTFATPSEEMWHPSYQEMLSANVLTRQTLGGEAALASTFVTGREDFVRIMEQLPLWGPLRRKYPQLAERMIDTAMAVRQRGGTDQELGDSVRAILISGQPLILRDASDDLLVRYMRLALDQTLAAKAVSYEACARFTQGRLNIITTLPRELSERDMAIQAEALNSPARQGSLITDDEVMPYLESVFAALSQEQIDAVAELDSPAPAHVRCEGSIAYLRGVLALPDGPRAMVIRWSFAQMDAPLDSN